MPCWLKRQRIRKQGTAVRAVEVLVVAAAVPLLSPRLRQRLLTLTVMVMASRH